jgi:MFS family permease
MTNGAASTTTAWRVATFLALASALNYADRAAMSAVLPAVRSDLQLSDVSLGLLGSVFLWCYALGSPLAGALADRWSRTRIIVGSLLAWSAVTALTGAATGFTHLLVLRFALGAAECLFLPAAIALIADWHAAPTRARAMSFISIGVNGGMILGGSFAGYMAERHGWRSGFWVLGLAGIALAVLARPMLASAPNLERASSAPRAPFLDAVRYLARVPSYFVLVGESLLSGVGVWIFLTWLPLYFKDTYNMSLAGAGFAGTFMLQISVMLGVIVGGWISDRFSARAPHRRMLLYSVFYFAAAPFLLLFLGQPSFPVVAAGIAAFSFLRGLGQSNDNATQCEIVPPQYRATGVGIMNAISTGAGGSGVLLAGFLKREMGLDGIFASISGIFALAGTLLLFGYIKFIRRDIQRAASSR